MRFLELWLIENSIVAALLALLVLILSHAWRPRPAMEHLLWVAVLIKFVAPPLSLWPDTWHTPLPAWMSPVASTNSTLSPPVAADATSKTFVFSTSGVSTNRTPQAAPTPSNAPQPTPLASRNSRASVSSKKQFESANPVQHPIALAWLTSTVLAAMWQVRRWRKFQRGLSGAVPASEALLSEVKAVARSLKLRTPRVLVSEIGATPLVWGVWRPTLLWPARLDGRLSDSARQTVLLHELTHLRRRDHWTAWLDLTAGCLWWWHPACWLARSRMREAAELACDAEVLQRQPEAGHDYATALVTVCELMSQSARPALTVGAVSPARRFFARRLTMILSKRLLTGVPLLFTGVLAGVLLMLLPKLPPLTYQQPKPAEAVGMANVAAEAESQPFVDRPMEVTLASERRGERKVRHPETKRAEPKIEEAMANGEYRPMNEETAVGPPTPATDTHAPNLAPASLGEPEANPFAPPRIPQPEPLRDTLPPPDFPSVDLQPRNIDSFDGEVALPVNRPRGKSLLEFDPALQVIEIHCTTPAGNLLETPAPMDAQVVTPQPPPQSFDVTWGKSRLRCVKVEYHHPQRGSALHATIQAGPGELQIQAPGLKLGGLTKLSLNLLELKIEPARIDALLKSELRIIHASLPSGVVPQPGVPQVHEVAVAVVQWGELVLYVTEAEFAHGPHAEDPVKLQVNKDTVTLIRKEMQLQAKQILLKPDSVTVTGAGALKQVLPPTGTDNDQKVPLEEDEAGSGARQS